MLIYCIMSGEERTDLENVIYATTCKRDAEKFACENEFYDYNGDPYIEVLDVEEMEGEDECI